MNKKLVITPSDFFKLDKNPLWLWLDLYGDLTKKEPLSEFTLKVMEDGNLHEKEYVATLHVSEVTESDPEKGIQETLRLMKEGVQIIYQGWLEKKFDNVIYRGRPDLLERRSGNSHFGDWIYVPIDIKSSSEPKPLHRHQLAFYSLMLSTIQGYYPKTTAIINKNFDRLDVNLDDKVLLQTQKNIDEILAILKGERPKVFISSSVKETPWYKECLREAEELQDISLIYKLRKDTVEALRKLNIDTFTKLAIQKIDDLPKIPGASPETLYKAKIQAQSLLEKKPILIGNPEPIEESQIKLYFDIEGDPWIGVEYLFGFWVVGDAEGKYAKIGNIVWSKEDLGKYFIYFIAETPELEHMMWNNFLSWLDDLPKDYRVYHYSNYEKTALKKLSEKYEGSEALQIFQSYLIDLKKSIEQSVIFPLYFYSIKDIAKSSFVNFKWRHEKAGGGQSIFWYEHWLETKDRNTLQDIIDYNEDDVRATEHLHL